MNRQGEKDDITYKFFSEILDISFVKKSFDDLIYHKIIIDGYVYCKEGLVASNKNIFKPIEETKSPLYDIIKDKNPSTYKEVFEQFRFCSMSMKDNLSRLEEELVLYIIFQINKPCSSAKVMMILNHYYSIKGAFVQTGEFVHRNNVVIRKIDSLQQFIQYVSEFKNVKNLFYRGHSNVNYLAVPSLFREKRYYQNEYRMYQELVIRCASSFLKCSSHLDFLMEMQHYGLPTRLLDVTSNPLVALYFACEQNKNHGEVIVYNIDNQNIKYEKCDEVSILTALPMFEFSIQKQILRDVSLEKYTSSPVYRELISEVKSERHALLKDITYEILATPQFVKPVRKNSRILRQEGAFLIWGLDNTYYGEGNQQDSKDDIFRYKEQEKKMVYYIPSNKKKEIIACLNKVGINKAFVYPEIDDVAAYIKDSIQDF